MSSTPFLAINDSVPVSLAQRFRDLRTPYDFGAKGVVGGAPRDDTAALNAAFKQLGEEGGGRIYLPGTFYASGQLISAPNVEITGMLPQPRSKLRRTFLISRMAGPS